MALDNIFFESRYRIGTKILKFIKGAWREGTVTVYNILSSWPYWISYGDGDSEEMNHATLRRHISRQIYKQQEANRLNTRWAQTNLRGDNLPEIDSGTFGNTYPDKPWENCLIIIFQNIGQQPQTSQYKSIKTAQEF